MADVWVALPRAVAAGSNGGAGMGATSLRYDGSEDRAAPILAGDLEGIAETVGPP
jgi:hypothetical protein